MSSDEAVEMARQVLVREYQLCRVRLQGEPGSSPLGDHFEAVLVMTATFEGMLEQVIDRPERQPGERLVLLACAAEAFSGAWREAAGWAERRMLAPVRDDQIVGGEQ